MKKNIAKKLELKKVVVKKMNVKTGVKGGITSMFSCFDPLCYTK